MAEARKGKMKKSGEFAERVERIRRTLGMSQEALAEEFGISRPRVSEWESGKVEPSAEVLLKLADIAPELGDKLWFWEQAGIDKEQLLRTAGEELKVDPGDVLAAVLKNIPDETRAGLAAALGELPRNAELYVVDAEKARGGMFSEGDVFLLQRVPGPDNLQSLWNQILLVEFARRDQKRGIGRASESWPEGLFMGRLLCKRDVRDALNYYATLGPLNDSETIRSRWDEAYLVGNWKFSGPLETAEEAAERERLTAEMANNHEEYERLQSRYSAVSHSEFMKVPEAKRLRERSEFLSLKMGELNASKDERARKEASLQARDSISLWPGVRIVGRVIGWFAKVGR